MVDIFYDPNLTQADRLVLECLDGDIKSHVERANAADLQQDSTRADDLGRLSRPPWMRTPTSEASSTVHG